MARRERLRSTTGCLRCRQRRKKCDELRPACSFCAKWRAECIRPSISGSNAKATRNSENQSAQEVFTSTNVCTRGVRLLAPPVSNELLISSNVLNNFSIPNAPHCASSSTALELFYFSNINSHLSSNVVDSHPDLLSGLLESAFLDEAVYSASVSFWANRLIVRTPLPALKLLGMRHESRTLNLLRGRIESGLPVTEETLLAASVHFHDAALNLTDRDALRKVLMGISALVESIGGIDKVIKQMKSGTFLSVMACDYINSLLNAVPHQIVNLVRPTMPESLEATYTTSISTEDLTGCLYKEVILALRDFDLMLFIRPPRGEGFKPSVCESQYILSLTQWVDYQLGVLQASLIGKHSLSEIVVLALILVKVEGVKDVAAPFPILVSTLLQRLELAIAAFPMPTVPVHQTLILWASFVGLMVSCVNLERSDLFIGVRAILQYRFRKEVSWPINWESDLRLELQRILWHEMIDRQYARICSQLNTDEQCSK